MWKDNELGANLWQKEPDEWIAVLPVSAKQGYAFETNGAMLALAGLLKNEYVKSSQNTTVCRGRVGKLSSIGAVSHSGTMLEGEELATTIGAWIYVATYVHPREQQADAAAELALLRLCKNPASERAWSLKAS